MSEGDQLVMEAVHRTFPKSVQPGIPKLKPLKDGWTRTTFGDLLSEIRRPISMGDNEVYDLVTAKRARGGLVLREKLAGRKISVKSQFKLREGDFLISKRQIVHGACGVVPPELDGAIVSNEYSVLNCKSELDSDFLNYLSHTVYFQQTCFHSSIGVHIEKMIFKLDDWLRWQVDVPTLPEQKKIAAFLGAVDARIAGARRRRDLLETYKRGLMQALFSRTLRFTRDDGTAFPDWGEKQLGKIGETFGGLSGKTADDFGNGQKYVTYKQIFGSSVVKFEQCQLVAIDAGENQHTLRYGDVLFTTSSETPNEVGFASVIDAEPQEDIYLNSFCFALRPNSLSDLVPSFSRYLFRSALYREVVFPLAQGSTRFNLSKASFKRLKLFVPHPDEQQKIADALSAMDAKIEAVAGQVAQLEVFKKGLLQQMFV